MITYVIPTRDRHAVLHETLAQLRSLPSHNAEILIIDNASSQPVTLPRGELAGLPTRIVRSTTNLCAAARNLAIRHADARSQWLVMLDDDSHPLDIRFLRALGGAPADVGVIAAEIFLPPGPIGQICRESGGLPEVFIGCGCAIRTELFRGLGGYDPSFDYYAEEYDLAARVLLSGARVVFDRSFPVLHRKVTAGRNMNRIIGNLVRNNSFVAARYAPAPVRAGEIREHLMRYLRIARKEHALAGYLRGVYELGVGIGDQHRREMSPEVWDRFTGFAAARHALHASGIARSGAAASIVLPGKNVPHIERAARELGVRLVADPAAADVWIVGTLSPGPMLDARETLRDLAPPGGIVLPWLVGDTGVGVTGNRKRSRAGDFPARAA